MKNQSGLAPIIILIIVIIIVGGGILAYRYLQTPKEEIKAPTTIKEILPEEGIQPKEEEKRVETPTYYTIEDPIDVTGWYREGEAMDTTYFDVVECRISVTDQKYKFEIELAGDVDMVKGEYKILIDSDDNASTGYIKEGGVEYRIEVDYDTVSLVTKGGIYEHKGGGTFLKIRDIEYRASDNILTVTADLTPLDMCNANLWVQTSGETGVSDKTDSVLITAGCL